MLEFFAQFFKLTLDNVYRFTCSLLFILALVGLYHHHSPLAQAGVFLDWLAIPSSWLDPVGEWVGQRAEAVGGVAAFTLMVAMAFGAANDWRSRSGSTTLLSLAFLIEVGQGWRVIEIAGGAVGVLILITGGTAFVARRVWSITPAWIVTAWEGVGSMMLTLFLALLYVVSPLGWLISQESRDACGSRLNPLYVAWSEPP